MRSILFNFQRIRDFISKLSSLDTQEIEKLTNSTGILILLFLENRMLSEKNLSNRIDVQNFLSKDQLKRKKL